jgi:hypothetical protein
VTVTFKPTTGGARTGTLTVNSNANNSPTTVALSGTGIDGSTNVAAGKAASASSSNGAYTAANLTDSDASSYWESAAGAFPQWAQVDLGQSYSVGKVVLKLPPATAWATRQETLSLLGSTDGSSFSTLKSSASYTFDPSTGNTVTLTFTGANARYVRADITANTGWNAAQLSDFEVFPGTGGDNGGGGDNPPPAGNLAAGKSATESSHTQTYAAANVTDGNQDSYWESANNAFPQWVQVDLGAAQSVGKVVLELPASWGARSETLAVTGSTDGSSFGTLKSSASYTFDPNSGGNTVTITFPAASQRYVRVTFTANTGWPAGQLSELQVWGS